MNEPNEDFDNETALLDAQMNKQLAESDLDLRATALMYFVSKYDDELETIPLAIPYSLAAADLYGQLDNQVSKLAALWSAASGYEHLEQFEEAINHYLVVEQIADQQGMTLRQGRTLYKIALCHEALKNHHTAIAFCQQALPLMVDLSNNLNQAEIHKTLGENHFKLKEFEIALDHFDKSLQFYKKAHAQSFYVQAYGRKAEALIKLERWDEATKVFKSCQAHQNTLRDPDTKNAALLIEAGLDAHNGDHLAALALLDEIDNNLRETANLEGLAINCVSRAKSLAAIGDHHKAIKELEKVQLLCEGENFDVDLLEVTLMLQTFSETNSHRELGVSA